MNKRKKSGPSCFGSLILLAGIVLGLKILYDRADEAEIKDAITETESYETKSDLIENESLYDILLRELSAYSTEITFDYDCTDELFDTFQQVCDDHPELFWLNGSGTSEKLTREIRTKEAEVSVTLKPEPILTLVEILKYQAEMNAAVQNIISAVDPAWTDYEKILYVHDYLVENTEYDTECAAVIEKSAEYNTIWQSSSAYGCLVKNSAVCSGYSAAFQLLMGELGIPCVRISGEDSQNGTPHEWNCVKLEDKWYFVDTTWDDPVYSDEDSVFSGTISYEYFMISEKVLRLTHTIAEGETVPECTDDSYSYYIYNNEYLETYDFVAAAEIIVEQAEHDRIEIRFSSVVEAEAACQDLFENKRFYEIEGISASELFYSIGKNGLLRICMNPNK